MRETRVPTTEEIEQRAYEIYRQRGCGAGQDLNDWLTAEKELIQSAETSSSGATETRAAAAGARPAPQKAGRVAE